jgi:hypothetical protein
MQDFFYTVLVIWLLWRIFGASGVRTNYQSFNQQNHDYSRQNHSQQRSEIKGKQHTTNKSGKNDGEYVDYEDVT